MSGGSRGMPGTCPVNVNTRRFSKCECLSSPRKSCIRHYSCNTLYLCLSKLNNLNPEMSHRIRFVEQLWHKVADFTRKHQILWDDKAIYINKTLHEGIIEVTASGNMIAVWQYIRVSLGCFVQKYKFSCKKL